MAQGNRGVVGLRFFVAVGERRGRDHTRSEKSIGKTQGLQRYPEKVRRKPPGPQGGLLMASIRLPRKRGWGNLSVPYQASSSSLRPRGEVCQRAWSSPCFPCPVQHEVPRTSRSLVRPRLLTRVSALPWGGPSDHPLKPYGCVIDAPLPGKIRTCTAHLSTASGESHGERGT